MLSPIAYEGEGRDGYRDQIVTCDVGVSMHSKIHPLFMKYSNGTSTHAVSCITVPKLVSCAFSTIPTCPFLIFIYLHVSSLFFLFSTNSMFITRSFLANLKLKELTHVGQSTQYINVLSPCHSPNCSISTESSPQNVLTCNWVRKLYTVELSFTELRNVRDSVAQLFLKLRSLAESGTPWFSGVAPQC